MLFLSLSIGLSNSALALRNQQQEDPSQLAGLEEALKDPAKAIHRLTQLVAPTPSQKATPILFPGVTSGSLEGTVAGLEEGVASAVREAIESGKIAVSQGRNITGQHLAPPLRKVRQEVLDRNREAQDVLSILGEKAIWVTPKTAMGFVDSPIFWPIHNARGSPYQVMMSRTIQTGVIDTKGTGKTKKHDSLGGDSPIVVGANSLPGPPSLANILWFGSVLPISLTEMENGLRWQEFGLTVFGEPLPLSVPVDLIQVKSIRDGGRDEPIREFLLDVDKRIQNVWDEDPDEGRIYYTEEHYKTQLAWAVVMARQKYHYLDDIPQLTQKLATKKSLEDLVDEFLEEVTPVQMRSVSPPAPRVSLLEALMENGAIDGIRAALGTPYGDFLKEKAIIDQVYRQIAEAYGEKFVPLPNDKSAVMQAVRNTGSEVNPDFILFSIALDRYAKVLYVANKDAFDRIVRKAAEYNAQNLGVLLGVGGYAAESFARRNLIAGGFARDFDNSELPTPTQVKFDSEEFERETAESLVFVEYGLGYLRYFLTGERGDLPKWVKSRFKKELRETFVKTKKAIVDNRKQALLSPKYVRNYKSWLRRVVGHIERQGGWYRRERFSPTRDNRVPGKWQVELADVFGDYLDVFISGGRKQSGLEELQEERDVAIARELTVVVLGKVYDASPAVVESPVLIFTGPETFDLVPLAVRWGRPVGVDYDGPEADALRDLLNRLPLPKGAYAIGKKATDMLLQESENPVWIANREDALRRLGLNPDDLPPVVREAIEITRDYLGQFV